MTTLRKSDLGTLRQLRTVVLLAVFHLVVDAGISRAGQVCGDVDGSGGVTVTDGVNVLRAAAGLPVDLKCQGASATPGPAVVLKDSNGLVFGVLADEATVIYALGATPIFINLNNQHGAGGLAGDLYFASTNCTGAPFVTGGLIVLLGAARGGTLYAPNGQPAMQEIRSWDRGDGVGCEPYPGNSRFAAPATTIDISQFVPPFHAEIQ